VRTSPKPGIEPQRREVHGAMALCEAPSERFKLKPKVPEFRKNTNKHRHNPGPTIVRFGRDRFLNFPPSKPTITFRFPRLSKSNSPVIRSVLAGDHLICRKVSSGTNAQTCRALLQRTKPRGRVKAARSRFCSDGNGRKCARRHECNQKIASCEHSVNPFAQRRRVAPSAACCC
jgi:hypothetical protein